VEQNARRAFLEHGIQETGLRSLIECIGIIGQELGIVVLELEFAIVYYFIEPLVGIEIVIVVGVVILKKAPHPGKLLLGQFFGWQLAFLKFLGFLEIKFQFGLGKAQDATEATEKGES
jgi:hypothetical protein